MASFDIHGFDDVIKELDRVWRFEEIAPEMLGAVEGILEENVKAEVRKHKDTGDMERSIRSTGAVANKAGGYYLAVRPTGKDRKGVRNMEKLAYLEYGTEKEAARPVLSRAVRRSEQPIIKKMQEVYEMKVGAS